MRNPGKPGYGFTGADVSLGGDNISLLNQAGSRCNDQVVRRAATLDREADHLLHLGHHLAAEQLAWRAESLRAGGAA